MEQQRLCSHEQLRWEGKREGSLYVCRYSHSHLRGCSLLSTAPRGPAPQTLMDSLIPEIKASWAKSVELNSRAEAWHECHLWLLCDLIESLPAQLPSLLPGMSDTEPTTQVQHGSALSGSKFLVKPPR